MGNKLIQVEKNKTTIAAFVYDGDGREAPPKRSEWGNRVSSTINGNTTKFVGEYYEVTGTDITKYYGKTALRKNGVLTYLLADHLGSNSYIVDTSGTKLSETRYTAWGVVRYSSGTSSTPYTYTGQYSNTSDFGWMYYKARWYDTALGRFNQPDSIVPGAGDPRAWDRFAYVKNSPVVYSDPSGHMQLADGDNVPMQIGERAAFFARVRANNHQTFVDNDCTFFTSTNLADAGLTTDNEWNPDDPYNSQLGEEGNLKDPYFVPVINVVDFYNYLLRRFGASSLLIIYSGRDTIPLKENQTVANSLSAQVNNIPNGSLVFYDDSKIGGEWNHVAMVVGQDVDPSTGLRLPIIAEHSGPYTENNIRFANDSPNTSIIKIYILIFPY